MSRKSYSLAASIIAVSLFSTAIGTGVASAANADPTAGIFANEEWVRTTPAPQDLFTTPGIGKGMADRALPEAQPYVGIGAKTKIGDVNVTATIEKLPSTSPGTVFIETGPRASTHAQYDGTSNIFFAGATVPTLPALDFSASSSSHCVDANSSLRDKLNFKGDCEMVDLVLKFDRPVNGAIIDFSGLGGAYQFFANADRNVSVDSRDVALNLLRGRSSFMAQSFELLTPNVNMELSNADSTNLQVENNTIKNVSNIMGSHCRPNSLAKPSGVYGKFDILNNPNHEAAGCGSVLINGQNMTELRFRIRTHTTPFTAVGDPTWGGVGQPGEAYKTNVVNNPLHPNDNASAPADSINGYYWHPDFGTAKLINDNTVMNNPITDKVRLSIRIVKYSIGDYVWFDADEDGIQDADELPAKGVKVHLLNGDGSPVLDSEGNPVTTTTNDEGKYIFNDLTHNVDYKVRIEPPKGFEFTKSNVGGDDAEDNSKVDAAGVTKVVRFDSNKYKEDPEGYSLVNLKLDAGLVVKPKVPDNPGNPNDPVDPNPGKPNNPSDPNKPNNPGTSGKPDLNTPNNNQENPVNTKKVVLKAKLVNTGSPAQMLSILALVALGTGLALRFALRRKN